MMIIDAHAHIYPDKIAEKATEAIGNFYDIKMQEAGTTLRLLLEGKEAGVDKFIVHSCATKASQVHAINEFIKNEAGLHKEFIPFMTLHEDMTEEEMESNRASAAHYVASAREVSTHLAQHPLKER